MARERSFWSSIPGVLTGIAGLLTGVGGLLGLSVSQGWLGDGSAEKDPEGPSASENEVVVISVEPERLVLTKAPVGEAVETVVVKNEGNGSVAVTTEVIGENASEFTAGTCNSGQIAQGRSCEVDVTFDAGFGTYQAILVVSANDGEDAQEVTLEGRSGDILGGNLSAR